jgi:K+-sensing histidine kinase KdpD
MISSIKKTKSKVLKENEKTDVNLNELVEILSSYVDIFRAIESGKKKLSLKMISKEINNLFGVDLCVFLQYDQIKQSYTQEGMFGSMIFAKEYKYSINMISNFIAKNNPKTLFFDSSDELEQFSNLFREEGIVTVIICPFPIERQSKGLLIANSRKLKNYSKEELNAFQIFTTLSALTLRKQSIQSQLIAKEQKNNRDFFLNWIRMSNAASHHETNSRLSTIRIYTELIQRNINKSGNPSPQDLEISEFAKSIGEIIEKFLESQQKIPISWRNTPDYISLEKLLQKSADKFINLISVFKITNISFCMNNTGLKGINISGNEYWLIFVIDTLLNNAMRAVRKGGEVELVGVKNGKWAEIRIKDTGPGFPMAIRDLIFRAPIPQKYASGMGTGCLISAAIIEYHKGTIQLEELASNNTTILIKLPIVDEKLKPEN